MNLYIRYFDDECVVTNVEEAFDFLSTLPGITIDDYFKKDLRQYMENPMPYPKRYKVRPRVYFIVIKTTAKTLAEFKEKGNKQTDNSNAPVAATPKPDFNSKLAVEHPGWYDASIVFKRVVCIPGTNKFQYKDTNFRARLKAYSGQDCYNRIVDHLRSRQDIDPRSQFPSARGRNFSYTFLGMQNLEA